MTEKQWKDVRGRLYRILKIINESPTNLRKNDDKSDMRIYFRTRIMMMIDYVEDIIEGRTDRPY